MTFSRRSFLGATATSLAFAAFSARAQDEAVEAETYLNEVEGYGALIPDPKGMIDLPPGFRYQVISQAGETMSDGLLVPGKADGMGCFALDAERVLLVRNHELSVSDIPQRRVWPERAPDRSHRPVQGVGLPERPAPPARRHDHPAL